MTRGWALVAACAVALAGCEARSDSAGGADPLVVTADTVAGVVHVRNAGRPPGWRLDSLVTVGVAARPEGPAPDEFGSISSVTISPRGELFVADPLNHEIRVFGLDGTYRRTIGRAGAGPGEFGSLYSIAWVDTVLLALDFGNGRVGELTADGTWLGQRFAPGRLTGPPRVLRLYRVGPDDAYAFSLRSTPTGSRRVWVRHDHTGVVGEISPLPAPELPAATIICDRPDGAISFFDIPFQPRFVQHPAAGGLIATAATGEYRIALLTPEGDTALVVERTYSPVPVGDAEWDAGVAEFQEFREGHPGASCKPRSPARPAVKPAIADLLVDVTGRMWVEVFTEHGTRWEIFAPDGTLLAWTAAFPQFERTAPYLGERYVATVVADSVGVQRVQVYEIHDQGA